MPSRLSSESVKGGGTAANTADEASWQGWLQARAAVRDDLGFYAFQYRLQRHIDELEACCKYVGCVVLVNDGLNPSVELWGLLLDYQRHYWDTVFVPLWLVSYFRV